MKQITVEAKQENLQRVWTLIEGVLKACGCSQKVCHQVELAVEEIYVNIASYAYGHESGPVTVEAEGFPEEGKLTILFRDRGRPFDPLKKQDPDITLAAEKRKCGGLGIFMVKKMMDEVSYEVRDGSNVLTIKKYF